MLCCVSFFLSAQSYTWWEETVHWDGVTPWERYIVFTPGFLGPNALPVPRVTNGSIDSVNLTTHVVTTLYNGGQRPDGLAYDNSGHLFAVLSLNEVAQLHPVTGAVLKTISTPNKPDGMTFDATTGRPRHQRVAV